MRLEPDPQTLLPPRPGTLGPGTKEDAAGSFGVGANTLGSLEKQGSLAAAAMNDFRTKSAFGYDDLLRSTAVDAFVITDTYRGNPQAGLLEDREAPFVAFGRPWDEPAAGHPWVDVDGPMSNFGATIDIPRRTSLRIRLKAGELTDLVAVPTSVATREQAARLGIPLTTLNDRPILDLTIDGADEVDPAGDLIKGHGDALLWEKIVAAASKKLVIVVDTGKLVPRLGTKYALPVEVVRFGWQTHQAAIRELGAEPTLKRDAAGQPVVTDEGHYLIHCAFPEGISDPRAVDLALKRRPGVVETGLFLGFRPEVIVGNSS